MRLKSANPGHPRNAVLLVGMLFLLPVSGPLFGSDAFAVVAAAQENTVDGCTSCGCQSEAIVQTGDAAHWWMVFGLVEATETGDWVRHGPAALSYCGMGKFISFEKHFPQSKGVPYAVVEAEIRPKTNGATAYGLDVAWTLKKLQAINKHGKPKYQTRRLRTSGNGDIALQAAIPVLQADAREQDQFRILEVIATIQGTALNGRDLTYGNIAVEGDVPGAEVLVDGDLAGRVAEGEALLLENIPAGTWTVSIRDFTGRTGSQSVIVHEGQTAVSRIELLEQARERTTKDFVSLGSNPEGFEERWRVRDGVIVVRIPEGPFLMGSEHPQSEADERPSHQVVVDEFLIDKTEVTWRQYAKFASSEGHALPPSPMWGQLPHYPLSFVTWEEAEEYCRWVGGRLPTEAEWEKAARGTDGRDYPWGKEWDPTRCNSISGGMHRPQPVGSYHGCASPYGVLDMAGSHWQWVSDWYGADYYANSPERNPQGPATGSARVKRGGYWMNHPTQIRVTHRGKSAPDWRNAPHGFRCAHDGMESGE